MRLLTHRCALGVSSAEGIGYLNEEDDEDLDDEPQGAKRGRAGRWEPLEQIRLLQCTHPSWCLVGGLQAAARTRRNRKQATLLCRSPCCRASFAKVCSLSCTVSRALRFCSPAGHHTHHVVTGAAKSSKVSKAAKAAAAHVDEDALMNRCALPTCTAAGL